MSSLKEQDLLPTDIPPMQQYPAGKNTPSEKNILNIVARREKDIDDNGGNEGLSDGVWGTKKEPLNATEEEKKKQKYLSEWLFKAQNKLGSLLHNEVLAIMECMASELYDLAFRIAIPQLDPEQGIIPKTRLFRGKPPIINGKPIFDSYGAELTIASKKIPDFITWKDYSDPHDRGIKPDIDHNQQFVSIAYLSRMFGNYDLNAYNIGLIDKQSLPASYDYRIVDYGAALRFGNCPLPDVNNDFFDMRRLTYFVGEGKARNHFHTYYRDDYYYYQESCAKKLQKAAISFLQVPPHAIKAICDKYDRWLEPYIALKCNLSELFGLEDFKAGSIYTEIIRRQNVSRDAVLCVRKNLGAHSTELHPTRESITQANTYLASRQHTTSNQAAGWNDYIMKRDGINKKRIACTTAIIKKILEPFAADHDYNIDDSHYSYQTHLYSHDLPLLDGLEKIFTTYGAKRKFYDKNTIESIAFDNENTLMHLGTNEIEGLQKRLKETMEELEKKRADEWQQLIPKLNEMFSKLTLLTTKPVCSVKKEFKSDYPILIITLETEAQKKPLDRAFITHVGCTLQHTDPTNTKTVLLSCRRSYPKTYELIHEKDFLLDCLLTDIKYSFDCFLRPVTRGRGR